MSAPFQRRRSGGLPSIPLNRKGRARLRRLDPDRYERMKRAAWRMLLDPMEQRVLLSADPLNIQAGALAGATATNDVTIRFFEEDDAGTVVQKVSVLWAGGTADITEIGVDDRFVVNTGSGDDAVSVIFDTRFDAVDDDFEIIINTEDGTDTVTVTSFAEGFTGDLNLDGETINIASGVSIGTDATKAKSVTLDADATYSGSGIISAQTRAAQVTINGSVIASDAVTISADAVSSASQTTYVLGLAGFDLTSDADVTIGASASIKGSAVQITADAKVDIDVSAEFALAAIAISDGTASADVTVADGATIVAGTGDLDATTAGAQSLAINATSDLDINVSMRTPATFISDSISGSPAADIRGIDATATAFALTGFDLLYSDVDADRTAQVTLGDAAAGTLTITAGGEAAFGAETKGDISNIARSNVVGLATTDIAQDHAIIAFNGADVDATSITAAARTGGDMTAIAKAAQITGGSGITKVSLDAETDLAASTGAIALSATDAATFNTKAESVVLDPSTTDFQPGRVTDFQLGYAYAVNVLDRDAIVDLVSGSVVTASSGAVSINARSDVQSIVIVEKLQMLQPLLGSTFSTSSNFSFGGTLSVNEMNGDVKVSVDGATLSAGTTLSIDATNDATFAAISESGTSINGASGGAVGVSIALNVLGHEMTNVGGYFGLALDTLIGLPLGVSQTGYGAEVALTDTALTSGGKTSLTTNNTLSATTFTTNAAKSTADSAFMNGRGSAAAFVLANNKIATKSRVSVDGMVNEA